MPPKERSTEQWPQAGALVTEREMFEATFKRPNNFFHLSERQRWEIDKSLGILDWQGNGLSEDDKRRFFAHYKKQKKQP